MKPLQGSRWSSHSSRPSFTQIRARRHRERDQRRHQRDAPELRQAISHDGARACPQGRRHPGVSLGVQGRPRHRGSYGEGVLIVRGEPGGYYNIISASFGFQLGAQAQTVIIMFMTEEALTAFRNAYGFKVGVDGSIVVVNIGAPARSIPIR